MALVFPLLLLLTFALIEYGWMFIESQHVNNTARHAARAAVIPYATNAEILSSIADFMESYDMGDSGYVVIITPADVSAASPGETVTVKIEVPYSDVNLLNIPVIPVPAKLSSSVSMAKEGP